MILLKPDQLAEFAAVVQAMGERAVIVVTRQRIAAFMGPRATEPGED